MLMALDLHPSTAPDPSGADALPVVPFERVVPVPLELPDWYGATASRSRVLREQARQSAPWLVADAGLVAFGVMRGGPVWVAAGALAAAAPLAWSAWRYTDADRHQRLLRQFALGEWETVRVLARELRPQLQQRPELLFDLDVRLAGIHARDHGLDEALERLEPWRLRLGKRPGAFDAGVASVHLMASDTAGHVAALERALAADAGSPWRRVEATLAQARFGDAGRADQLLGPLTDARLPRHADAPLQWARGLVQLRLQQRDALATLGAAVDTLCALRERPAAWIHLACCVCDHAVPLAQAGLYELARERIGAVWPVLQVHAPRSLLRLLEAESLLPAP